MKKIIDGKKYDSDTAELIESYSYSNRNDFNYISEDLYLKRTGEYFLYCEGGANSKYAVSAGNNTWSGSEQIIPLSFESAKEWAEEKMSGDKFEKLFGKVEEDESKKIISISISAMNHEKLKRAASEKGISVSGLIDVLIESLQKTN